MGLDSKLELFTTLFGWLFYNSIWEVLTATGIVFLPFIGIVVDTVINAYRNEDADEAGNTSLRIMEVEFFMAFFVVMLTGVPAVPLSASDLAFTPRAFIGDPTPATVTPNNSQSTYGGSISFVNYPNNVDLPVFWYVVLGFTSGFNRAVMEDVPATLNLREYSNDLRELRIKDPDLQAEMNDFFRDCFVEARSRYIEERPDSVEINELRERFGVTDTQWMGSHIFIETPGYYNTLRSDSIRQGFVYSQLRDLEWDVDDAPIYGKPFCNEWWSNATIGIAPKILAETGGIDLVAAAIELGWDAEQRRDGIIQAVLLNTPARWTNRGYDHAYNNFTQLQGGGDGFFSTLQNRAQQGAAGYGLSKESVNFAAYLRIFLEAAPMLQALILMGLYALLPFFILISRYRFSVFMIGALILFIVKFWSVLWFFSWWADQNLIRAFYPDPGALTTLFNIDLTLKRVVLNFLTGLMYIIFPLLFSTYLAFAGIGAARGLDGSASTFATVLGGASRIRPGRLPKFNPGKGKK